PLLGGLQRLSPVSAMGVDQGEKRVGICIRRVETKGFVACFHSLVKVLTAGEHPREGGVRERKLGSQADAHPGFVGCAVPFLPFEQAKCEERVGQSIIRIAGERLPELRLSEIEARLLEQYEGALKMLVIHRMRSPRSLLEVLQNVVVDPALVRIESVVAGG